MFKKVFLNVFYNIAIFTMGMCAFWGFEKQRYSIVLAAAFGLALFIFFKIRLIKEIRETAKRR